MVRLSSSGDLGCVEYIFIVIIPKSTDLVPSISQIDVLANY